MLAAPPVLVPDHLLHRVQFAAYLNLSYGDRDMTRRLGVLSAVIRADNNVRAAPEVVALARWLSETDSLAVEDSNAARKAVAGNLRMTVEAIEPGLGEKAKVPKSLIDAAPMDPDELRQAVTDYYRVRILGDLPSSTGH